MYHHLINFTHFVSFSKRVSKKFCGKKDQLKILVQATTSIHQVTYRKNLKKVIELLYLWTQTLPGETKINEAYQMLKRQSIITEDPNYINKSQITPLPQRTKSIFDADEEKSKAN